jgi:hypothetical protein
MDIGIAIRDNLTASYCPVNSWNSTRFRKDARIQAEQCAVLTIVRMNVTSALMGNRLFLLVLTIARIFHGEA